jgi:hypothetical protein
MADVSQSKKIISAIQKPIHERTILFRGKIMRVLRIEVFV